MDELMILGSEYHCCHAIIMMQSSKDIRIPDIKLLTVHVGHCSEITLFLQQNGSDPVEVKKLKARERQRKQRKKLKDNSKGGCHTGNIKEETLKS